MELERIENGKIYTYCTINKCYLFDETIDDRKTREEAEEAEEAEAFHERCENYKHYEKMYKKQQRQYEKWLAKYC